MNKIKIQKYIHYIITLTLLGAIGFSIFEADWTMLFISIITFILLFLPQLFEKKYNIDLPLEFELAIVIFIYATLFLGEVGDFYELFWWWDIILHIGSAIAFGLIGFIILFMLYRGKKIKANPIWIALFAFCFAVAIGAIWEIFEFGMDQIFGMNMQKSGLIDTMWDLIVDSLGALLTSVAGYIYLKTGKKSFVSHLITDFEKKNPGLYK